MIESLLSIWNMVPADLQTVLWILGKIIILMVPLMLSVAYLTYAERKVIGSMQVRIGPVGPRPADCRCREAHVQGNYYPCRGE